MVIVLRGGPSNPSKALDAGRQTADRDLSCPPPTGRTSRSGEDQTGFVWTYLSEARQQDLIRPGRVIVAGDANAPQCARSSTSYTPNSSGAPGVRSDLSTLSSS